MNKVISVPLNKGLGPAEVELATYDPQSHLNLWVTKSGGQGGSYMQFDPKSARELRDALIEIYPIVAIVEPEEVIEVEPESFAEFTIKVQVTVE